MGMVDKAVKAAVTAGFLIGFERHSHAKDAGIRTHMMVALGSCLVMLISKYGFMDVKKPEIRRVLRLRSYPGSVSWVQV